MRAAEAMARRSPFMRRPRPALSPGAPGSRSRLLASPDAPEHRAGGDRHVARGPPRNLRLHARADAPARCVGGARRPLRAGTLGELLDAAERRHHSHGTLPGGAPGAERMGLSLSPNHVTAAEMLATAGYDTAAVLGQRRRRECRVRVRSRIRPFRLVAAPAGSRAVADPPQITDGVPLDVEQPGTDAVTDYSASRCALVGAWTSATRLFPLRALLRSARELFAATDLCRGIRGPCRRPLVGPEQAFALLGKAPAGKTLETIEALYDAECTFTGSARSGVGSTSSGWERSDDAVVLVAADHGEEFGDHGGRPHEDALRDRQFRCSSPELRTPSRDAWSTGWYR